MFRSLSDDEQHNMVVYGEDLGVVVLAEGPRRAQYGPDHIGFHHLRREYDKHVWSVLES